MVSACRAFVYSFSTLATRCHSTQYTHLTLLSPSPCECVYVSASLSPYMAWRAFCMSASTRATNIRTNRARYKQIRTTERNSIQFPTGNSLFACAYGNGKLVIYTYIFKFCDEHKMKTQFHIWNWIDDVDGGRISVLPMCIYILLKCIRVSIVKYKLCMK